MRVLGIDPGTRLCGYALIDAQGSSLKHVDNGVFVLEKWGALPVRLARLWDELGQVIAEFKPDVAAVEGVFTGLNIRSALTLGHARGVALAAASKAGLEVFEYTPQQIKKAVTGAGRAEKTQIQQMVTLRLGLKEPPQEDAADAVAVALCHGQHLSLSLPHLASDGLILPVPPKGSKKRAAAGLEALVRAQQAEKQR